MMVTSCFFSRYLRLFIFLSVGFCCQMFPQIKMYRVRTIIPEDSNEVFFFLSPFSSQREFHLTPNHDMCPHLDGQLLQPIRLKYARSGWFLAQWGKLEGGTSLERFTGRSTEAGQENLAWRQTYLKSKTPGSTDCIWGFEVKIIFL